MYNESSTFNRLKEAGIKSGDLINYVHPLRMLAMYGAEVPRFEKISFMDSSPNIHIASIVETLCFLKAYLVKDDHDGRSVNKNYDQLFSNMCKNFGMVSANLLPPPLLQDEGKLFSLFNIFKDEMEPYLEEQKHHDWQKSRVFAKALGDADINPGETNDEIHFGRLARIDQKIRSEKDFRDVYAKINQDRKEYGNSPLIASLPMDYKELQQLFIRYSSGIEEYRKTHVSQKFGANVNMVGVTGDVNLKPVEKYGLN